MNTEEMMGKVLREGYTTGATATVAMKAAVPVSYTHLTLPTKLEV